MNTLSITLKFAISCSLVILFSCTTNQDSSENPRSANFETIEIGTSLEDARSLLTEEYTEHKIGNSPDMDIITFEDGKQLVFVDNILTDKNTAEEIEQAMNTRREATE